MRTNKWMAGLIVATAASATLAQDAPTTAELRAQIDALQKKVDQIEARQAAAPENRATADAVKANALQNSQLVAPGALVGGYDKGFKIGSADGKFVVKPGFLIQFRNITNYREDNDSLENGFELRRVRLRLDGNMFSKDLKYSFVLDNARNSGTTSILDAWVQYNFTEKWGVKAGQFRNSWTHEGDIGDNRQLADERGLVDTILGGGVTDREQGVALTYGSTGDNSDPFQGEIALTDGANSKNTDFRDSDGPDPTSRTDGNFGVSGRLSYKWFGNWGDYSQFSARGTKDELLISGAGVDFSENGDVNVTRTTIDTQYSNPNGLSAYIAANYNDTSGNTVSAQDYGIQGQVGYVINPQVEVFGRYGYLYLDTPVADQSSYNEFTIGANYFFGPNGAWGNAVRLTVDLNYLPDGSPGNVTGLGYLAGTDNQFVLRTQLQLQL